MKNILEEIYQYKLQEVRNLKKELSLTEICQKIKSLDVKKDFYQILRDRDLNGQISLICEVKKASPSKGIICNDFDHLKIAQQYEEGGATCLSVLTDQKYFMGSNEFLQEIRPLTNLPILRKDFIVDPYQIYQSKMIGADCILLIVAMLDDEKLIEFEKIAIDIGLSVLVEVHDKKELERASKLKSRLIGFNNRNLKTFDVDINNSVYLADQVDKDYVLVAESGINDKLDIDLLQQAGINCFLIGEYFMRQKNIVNAVKSFL